MTRYTRPYPLLGSTEVFVLSSTAIFLSMFPLTGAFAYEFSFILGIVAALTSIFATSLRLCGIRQVRPIETRDRSRALAASALHLLPPLLIILLNGFRVPTCRYTVGLAWFVLLPLISSFFGACSAIWATASPKTTTRALIQAFLPTLAFSLLTLRDLAVDPPLFFLHPAFGYFAGPLYDEWIPIRWPVVSFRVWTLALGTALVLSSYVRRSKLIPAMIFSLLALVFIFRSNLGWFASHETVQKQLPGLIESRWVSFHYALTRFSPVQATSFARSLDFYVESAARALHVELKKFLPVQIYLYGSDRQKHELTGTRFTAIGNPMQRTVHLLMTDPQDSLLPHEITHVVAAPYGIPGIGVSLRVGLLEGLATAMESSRDGLSVHEWARAMQELGVLPSIPKLMDATGFFGEAPSRAYLAAGSFCRWLIDEYGMDSFLKLYRGGSFEEIYGRPITTLSNGWETFLRRERVAPEALRQAEPSLIQTSIFERRCPHDVAAAMELSRDCWARSDWEGMARSAQEAVSYSRGLPGPALRQARAEAKSGNWTRVTELAKQVAQTSGASAIDRTWALLLWGDAAIAQRKFLEATQRYSELSTESLPDELRASMESRRALLKAGEIPLLQGLTEKGPTQEWMKNVQTLPTQLEFAPVFLLVGIVSLRDEVLGPVEDSLRRFEALGSTPYDRARFDLEARMSNLRGDSVHALWAYEQLEKLAKTQGDRDNIRRQIERVNFIATPQTE